MNGTHRAVLEWIVDCYDEHERPVKPESAATHFEEQMATVRSCFEYLEKQSLLTTVDGGYRPTVTARELLELDLDDDSMLVLDPDPADESE